MLKERAATGVLLFGSLAAGRFSPGDSDIDIYFEGIPLLENDMATGTLLDIFGDDVLDPIPAPYCSPA